MSFDEEQLDDLYAAFPDLRTHGAISSDDIRPALEKLGCPIAGHELREIQGGRGRGGGLCDINELHKIYRKAKFLKIDSKRILKDAILKGVQEAKTYDTEVGGKHTVTKSEEKAFANWINKHLQGDPDCEALGLIPINPDVDGQLYERCKNGIILAKMINVAVPNTIDDRTLEKGESLKAIFKRNENLTLVVNSAAAIGCCMVNIGPEDISEARRHLLCGLIWQLIRKAIVDTITLAQHSELASLLSSGETLEQLAALKPEELLMLWVNYHLTNANSVRRLTNFTTDLCDSEIYATLMEQITPLDLRSQLISSKVILEEPSLEKRAYMVMENARLLDAGTLLVPEDIYTAKPGSHSDKLNLGFIATLFNMYPGLETPEDLNIQPETLEEKTYRNWMNSMGVSPIVSNLYNNLNDGLVLLQLIDIIRPGTVDWKQVTTNFDPKRELFQKQTNCVLVIDYSKVIGIKVVNISGENIREGATKQILGLCFQFMRAYTHKLLKQASGVGSNAPIEDSDILTWVNDRLKEVGEPPISGFRDNALSNSRPIVAVLESISKKGASRNMLTDDNFANAVYALSSCRKAGARVYALPEHICTCNPKMIITIFACLIVLSYSLKVVPNQ
ncbi:Fimbrin [Echinococcus granulosus]|uniref:Fimbrin n=1 Tax=Echinococcus granulosus TaxID=6210 RepID=U6IWR5_ECHGR|nr:Fimbrin [Echinococcus granulosus]EUB64982.1 Fimbrin [Echinococcus granulosus]KAH9286937.1 Fimbrin [Echinococcus granulosus]CDS15469.1 fimbrin [Echinococcus granulosus]